MMIKKIILPLSILTITPYTLLANKVEECSNLSVSSHNCDTYGNKLIETRAKDIPHPRKKTITTKTLPLPKQEKKTFTIDDIIESSLMIEDSIRYKGTYISSQEKEILKNQTKDRRIDKDANLTTIKDSNKTFISQDKNKTDIIDFNQTIILTDSNLSIKDSIIQNSLVLEDSTIYKGIYSSFSPPEIISKEEIISKLKIADKEENKLATVAKNWDKNKKTTYSDKKRYIKNRKTEKTPTKAKKLKKKTVSKLSKKQKSKNKKYKFLKREYNHKLRVVATAYTSHRRQTDRTPFIAAWNNRLRPGVKAIAVSRDLIKRYGLKNGSRVKISGLKGYYRVRDKMNKRFKRKIDIYMGKNRRRALRWGRQNVTIYW